VDVEGDVGEQVAAALRVRQAQVAHGELDDVGDGRGLGAGRGQLGADHQLGELAGGRLLRVDGRDRPAAPDDRHVVGDGEHLVELVRDEEHGEALGLEAAQVLE